jgi:spermidine synthase
MVNWLVLTAYLCSGFAGLVYEVSWTRLLTLTMGRGLAASSTVLAAFMGGLAVGAALAGRRAKAFDRPRALRAYAGLEIAVALFALAVPFELELFSPLFAATYHDGSGATFVVARSLVSLVVVFLPAAALGATFPIAIRFFAEGQRDGGRRTARLYAANTIGAALGALLAGFVLIPSLGLRGATFVAVAASLTAAIIAVAVGRGDAASALSAHDEPEPAARVPVQPAQAKERRARVGSPGRQLKPIEARGSRPVLAGGLLAISGAATFAAEVTWTRVFGLIVGPSTYGFAATVAAFVGGLAIGSSCGAFVLGRTRRLELGAALALALSAAASAWAFTAAGSWLPERVALDFASAPPGSLLASHVLLVALTLVPVAFAIGAAYPLSLELAGGPQAPARTIAVVYAVNTIAGVVAALATGFLAVPLLGLDGTLMAVTILLACGAVVAAQAASADPPVARLAVLVPAALAGVLLVSRGTWDRELLVSGSYKYASAVPAGLDVVSALKAGSLAFYRDGTTATVSVKRLTGMLSLSIDGKVDASTGGDMATQKLLAHIPLLMHDNPREVCIIGLGSGVTLGSALTHPVDAVDMLEIAPEVVEASRLFAGEGGAPIDDRRTRLIVADGRTHFALTAKRYDVVVSEPSNPWMAGVAALFTREFFASVRAHLAEHGIICQWVNTYDISREDLQSIVATFRAVFPHTTMWLVGDSDLLLLGSSEPLNSRIAGMTDNWSRRGVADDLRAVGAPDAFAVLSTFLAGERGAERFASGAPLQTDDRMALEFSAPRALRTPAARGNVAALRALAETSDMPEAVRRAWAAATPVQLTERAIMLRRAGAYSAAYDAARAVIDRAPDSRDALQLLVESAVASGRQPEALSYLQQLTSREPAVVGPELALSRLQAATGEFEPAVQTASDAARKHPDEAAAFEQLASVLSDTGDADRLATVIVQLSRFPERPGSHYYAAAGNFLRGNLDAAQAAATYALTLDPGFARARNLLGAIAATRGDTAAARSSFDAAIALDPRDPATYQNLGLLELTSGHPHQAAELFTEALSLDPASEAARQGLARATGTISASPTH